MCYTGGMDKFWKAIDAFLNPEPVLAPLELDWGVAPAEIHRMTWAYAHLVQCTYEEAQEQLGYLTYADAKEFLGEG